MKLRYNSHFLAVACGLVAVAASSCKDDVTDSLSKQAYIEPDAFYVTSAVDKNRVYKAELNEAQDTFFIRMPQNANPEAELNGATAKFYLSLGADVTPTIDVPQNFADTENAPKYTVTSLASGHTRSYYVSYKIVEPQPIEPGELPASIDRLKFQPIGGSFGFNGDIIGSPAFCGLDNLVMFSRKYATLRLYDLPSLTVSTQQLQLPFPASEIVAVTSDSWGHLVVAIGGFESGKSEIMYWVSPTDGPYSAGTTLQSVEYELTDAAMMGSYLSCTGDITGEHGNAVIAFGGPRDDDGTHYKYGIYGGKLEKSSFETIKTGYPSNDMNQFQMISFFSIKKSSAYLVGDCQKSDKNDGMQDEVQIRLNDSEGNTIGQCDYYNSAYNGWHNCWQRTGQATEKKGGRRPTVHAMNLNGVELALFTTGGGEKAPQWERTLICDKNLTVYYTDYQAYDATVLLLEPGQTEAPWTNYYTGSAMMCDWCFDSDAAQGYIAVWYERRGLVLYDVSCIAML